MVILREHNNVAFENIRQKKLGFAEYLDVGTFFEPAELLILKEYFNP